MKSTRSMRTPTRTTRRKTNRRRTRSRPPTARRLAHCIGQLQSSVRTTITRADAVLAASTEIGDAARSAYRTELVTSLGDEGILAAIDRVITESTPADQAVGRFRDVLLGWLRRQFDLEPVYEPGQLMSVPRQALERLSVEGAVPDLPSTSLVKIRVIQSGWRVGPRHFLKPHVVTE